MKLVGLTQTVSGHSCGGAVLSETRGDRTTETELCVAAGMGFPPGSATSLGMVPTTFKTAFLTNLLQQLPDRFRNGFFPLRIRVKRDTLTMFTLEATKIEPRTVSEVLFSPPAGYQDMTGEVLQQMGVPPR